MIIDEQRQHIYKGYTLVDITNTGITKFSKEHELARNQQRNWETVQQILSLRGQLFSLTQSTSVGNIKKYEFGSAYRGTHQIWQFEFTVEMLDLYKIENNPVGVLEKDFTQTPVVTGLLETAKFDLPLFFTSGDNKNIYFKTLV
jgi:hypothetical protein